jgi:hypothetical protein
MFSNPFYAGLIRWEGKIYPGKHKPVVTVIEFEQVQKLLSRTGKPRVNATGYTYGGMIRCGRCNHLVTAEHKTNRYGSKYVYYHCAQRAHGKCSERSITLVTLEAQIVSFLETLKISDHVAEWALSMLSEATKEEAGAAKDRERLLEREVKSIERKRCALLEMRLDGLVGDQEYAEQRNALAQRSIAVSQELSKLTSHESVMFEPATSVILFSKNAAKWFRDGNAEDRRLILNSVCSNLTLANKVLSIQATEPLLRVPKSDCFPNWRAFMGAMRNMGGNSEFSTALMGITELRKRMENRFSGPGEICAEAA